MEGIEPLSGGAGSFRGHVLKIRLGNSGGHGGAFGKDRGRVSIKSLNQPSGGGAGQPHGEDGPLVGVDSVGLPVHILFRQPSCKAQLPEGFGRRFHPGTDAGFSAADKVRLQHRGASEKGENVHIPVGTAVIPVHQSRLRGGAYLVQQALCRENSNFAGETIADSGK